MFAFYIIYILTNYLYFVLSLITYKNTYYEQTLTEGVLLLSSVMYPGQTLPDVCHGGSGQEGCHHLVLELSPASVGPARLAHHLGGHGQQPLEDVLGPGDVVPPGAGGPQQEVAHCGSQTG